MIEFAANDVVFQMGNVTVAFIQDYDSAGWPGLVVQYFEDGRKTVVKAPMDVVNAVQLCAFNFTSICKKVEAQQMQIVSLREKLAKQENAEAAEVLPFKPKVT